MPTGSERVEDSPPAIFNLHFNWVQSNTSISLSLSLSLPPYFPRMSSFYGHKKQESSFGGGGGSWSLPPLPIQQTLMLHLNFAFQGAQDAIKLKVAGEKLSIDKVNLPSFLLSRVFGFRDDLTSFPR